MKLFSTLITATFALTAGSATLLADDHHADHDGVDLDVVNHTGHEVVLFMWNDDSVHLNEKGGLQVGHLANKETKVAKAPHCHFSLLLVDHEDVWHAEFHDCHSHTFEFTSDTGHDKKHK